VLTRREFLRVAGIAGVVAPGQSSHARAAQLRPSETPRPGDERIIEGIRLKWCPPGQFTMGSPVSEVGHRADEAQVPVTIARGFWMAKFETMQGEWRRIVGDFPERPPSPEFGIGDAVPVYWVNFAAADSFARRATELARRSGAIDETLEFRLPTEAQWEYACRAGTTTATAFGDSLSRDQANFSGEPLNGGRGGPAAGRATAVGRYPPNAWGLCDMHGNIFEWCRDWYHPRLPGGIDPDLSGTKGTPNRDGSYSRVRRGGAWNDPGWACRSALRLRYEPERSSDHIGFRVTLVRMA
jgi:sulfatase modifying factor 1